uniref:hypothetical protein n=1 Tax=Dyella sp. ASV21 TaxID=2795114 RepID=UPI001E5DBEBB
EAAIREWVTGLVGSEDVYKRQITDPLQWPGSDAVQAQGIRRGDAEGLSATRRNVTYGARCLALVEQGVDACRVDGGAAAGLLEPCLLYTSDAADDNVRV